MCGCCRVGTVLGSCERCAGPPEGAGSSPCKGVQSPAPAWVCEAVSCRRLTQLAVDTGAGPRGNQTVLFLGAEDGRVLKVLAATQRPEATRPPAGTPAPGDTRELGDSRDSGAKTLLLEEISLYDPGR